MLTLQEAQNMVEKMNEDLKELGLDEDSKTDEAQILGLHESATKLWLAVKAKEDQSEIDRRVASALIGVMVFAIHFNVRNLEESFLKRVKEVVENNTNFQEA